MGKVLSKITREVKMYNIESRAHKVISKEKPNPAPLHDKSKQEIEQMMRENPSALIDLQKKNENLTLNLKSIYVLSHDPETVIQASSKKRPLPQSKHSTSQPEYGYVEPEEGSVPLGKFTLKQALQFLSDHQTQPEVYTAEAIAKQYKINQKLAENMVLYYSMFGLHIPKKEGQEKIAQGATPTLANMSFANATKVLEDYKEKQEEKCKIADVNKKQKQ